MLRGLDINIFTQIGFVVLVGLAAKNAILIVEFATQARGEAMTARRGGRGLPAAAAADPDDVFAFILGVLPLVIATGAGGEMRQALGTAVFSGMLGVTLFGMFLTPVFYVSVRMLSNWRWKPAASEPKVEERAAAE